MASKIDVDRGVLISVHQPSGMDIFMYKDTPGVYLNAFGSEVPEKLAAEAGYDIKRWGRERIKQERMKKAMHAIEQELEAVDTEAKQTVVKEAKGFKLVSIGLGRHHVYDPEGNMLTPVGMPKEQAEVIFDALIPKQKSKVKALADKK